MTHLPRFLGPALVAALCLTLPAAGRAAEDRVPTFNRDIRPLLSDRCFTCHGPDSNKREAELRLDTAEGAHEYAVIPGDPEGSELLARITSDDPEYRMPPTGSKRKAFTPREVELFRQWIVA